MSGVLCQSTSEDSLCLQPILVPGVLSPILKVHCALNERPGKATPDPLQITSSQPEG